MPFNRFALACASGWCRPQFLLQTAKKSKTLHYPSPFIKTSLKGGRSATAPLRIACSYLTNSSCKHSTTSRQRFDTLLTSQRSSGLTYNSPSLAARRYQAGVRMARSVAASGNAQSIAKRRDILPHQGKQTGCQGRAARKRFATTRRTWPKDRPAGQAPGSARPRLTVRKTEHQRRLPNSP